MDDNIRRVAAAFSITIHRRIGMLRFEGEGAAASAAKKAIERFRYMAKHGKRDLTEEDIELTLAELKLPIAANGLSGFAQLEAAAASIPL